MKLSIMVKKGLLFIFVIFLVGGLFLGFPQSSHASKLMSLGSVGYSGPTSLLYTGSAGSGVISANVSNVSNGVSLVFDLMNGTLPVGTQLYFSKNNRTSLTENITNSYSSWSDSVNIFIQAPSSVINNNVTNAYWFTYNVTLLNSTGNSVGNITRTVNVVFERQVNLSVINQNLSSWSLGDVRTFRVTMYPVGPDLTSSPSIGWNFDSSKVRFIGIDDNGNATFLNTGATLTSCSPFAPCTPISATYIDSNATIQSNAYSFFGAPSQLAWSFNPSVVSLNIVQGGSATTSLYANSPTGGWSQGATTSTTVALYIQPTTGGILYNGLNFYYSGHPSNYSNSICVSSRSWCAQNGMDNEPATLTITADPNLAPGTYYIFEKGVVTNDTIPAQLVDFGYAYLPIVVNVTPKPVFNLTTNPSSITVNAGDPFNVMFYSNGVQLDPSNTGVSVVPSFPSVQWSNSPSSFSRPYHRSF